MNTLEPHSPLLVLCSAAKPNECREIAQQLISKKLAACVSILPSVQSFYRWQGKTENSEECILLIKTDRQHYPLLEKEICQCHSYQVPEIIALDITQGLPAYLSWLQDSLSS